MKEGSVCKPPGDTSCLAPSWRCRWRWGGTADAHPPAAATSPCCATGRAGMSPAHAVQRRVKTGNKHTWTIKKIKIQMCLYTQLVIIIMKRFFKAPFLVAKKKGLKVIYNFHTRTTKNWFKLINWFMKGKTMLHSFSDHRYVPWSAPWPDTDNETTHQ